MKTNKVIFSSNKQLDIIEKCNKIFKANKDRGANWWDCIHLPKDWIIYNTKVHVPKKEMDEPSQCYENALKYAKVTGLPLIIGVFIRNEQIERDLKWINAGPENKVAVSYGIYPHAWNLDKDGNIYDNTIDNDLEEWTYYGTEVYANDYTGGFKEIMPYLHSLLEINNPDK